MFVTFRLIRRAYVLYLREGYYFVGWTHFMPRQARRVHTRALLLLHYYIQSRVMGSIIPPCRFGVCGSLSETFQC